MASKIPALQKAPAVFFPYVRARSGAPLRETCFPRKVLLIDEDQRFCHEMKHAAMLRNSLLVYCRSIADLTRLIEVDRFDLVIINSELHGFLGRHLGHFMRTFFRDVPVVMLSASAPSSLEEDLRATGTILGRVKRDLTASKTMSEMSRIFVKHFGLLEKNTEPLSSFDQAEYTEFCGKTRQTLMEAPAMKRFMATIGKVILANVSLIMPKTPSH